MAATAMLVLADDNPQPRCAKTLQYLPGGLERQSRAAG
jgi:hypothetical protein